MHIYHIMRQTEWHENPRENFRPASLVKQSFIHCCTKDQILDVIRQWFPREKNLLVMEIETDKLISNLKFENLEKGTELFPHIYGPINTEAIIQIKELIPTTEKE